MNITLSGLWNNTNNYIRAKIAEGLTPLQKKVAIFVIAYFALATCAFLVYRCFRQPSESSDYKKKDRHFTEIDRKTPRLPRTVVNNSLDVKEAVDDGDDLSEVKIAIKNADQLRSILNQYPYETMNRYGQWRTLYLDTKGRLQGIHGPDGPKIWLKDKLSDHDAALLQQAAIEMHKVQWDPSKEPAFTANLRYVSTKTAAIVEATIQELNQLARGAYKIAEAKGLIDHLGTPDWLHIFENATDYPADVLHREMDDFKAAAKSPKDDQQPVEDDEIKDKNNVDDLFGKDDEPLDNRVAKAVQKALFPQQQNKADLIPIPADLFPQQPDIKPVGIAPIKKTIAQRLEGNRQFALDQQKQEKAKGFKIIEGDFPEMITSSKSPLIAEEIDVEGLDECGRACCQGLRPTMEDADLAASGIINLKDAAYDWKLFGVFDGHGGSAASTFVKDKLQGCLINELAIRCQDGLTEEGIYHALKECCKKLDADYPGTDGTTATIALILDGRLWIANVGDSRTILVNQYGKAVQGSEDAKPTIDRYKKKVEKLGGTVFFGRVNGSLAVARAIGDKTMVNQENVCIVSPNPKITSYPLDFEYLVLACDGLYDVATTDEVGQAVKTMHDKGETAELMAKRLVYSALQRGSRDNVSVIVVKR